MITSKERFAPLRRTTPSVVSSPSNAFFFCDEVGVFTAGGVGVLSGLVEVAGAVLGDDESVAGASEESGAIVGVAIGAKDGVAVIDAVPGELVAGALNTGSVPCCAPPAPRFSFHDQTAKYTPTRTTNARIPVTRYPSGVRRRPALFLLFAIFMSPRSSYFL